MAIDTWEPIREGLAEAGGLLYDFQGSVANQAQRAREARKRRQKRAAQPIAKYATRTEQFLSDISEIEKGLPRYLKNLRGQYGTLAEFSAKHPQYAKRVKAHELGREVTDSSGSLLLNRNRQLGSVARAESARTPAFVKNPALAETRKGKVVPSRPAPLIQPWQMDDFRRGLWESKHRPRIAASKQRRGEAYQRWWERLPNQSPLRSRVVRQEPVNVVDWANQQRPPLSPAQRASAQASIARHANQAPAAGTSNVAAPVPVPAASANAPANTLAAPRPAAPVQQVQVPVAQVQHHPQPSVHPTQAPTVDPQQHVPAARDNKWLRRSIAGSLGLGTVGAGTAIGVNSYRKQNRNLPRVRRQWEW